VGEYEGDYEVVSFTASLESVLVHLLWKSRKFNDLLSLAHTQINHSAENYLVI
jgi:hypothetical protein